MEIDKKLMNIHDYLVYSADLTPEDSGFYYVAVKHAPFSEEILVCQEWNTQGEDQEDAVDMAKDLIITLAECFIEEKAVFPAAVPLKQGQFEVKLPYHVALKIMLRNLMTTEQCRITDLALYSGVSKQKVRKQLDLRRKTHIDTLAQFFKALGHPLKIEY